MQPKGVQSESWHADGRTHRHVPFGQRLGAAFVLALLVLLPAWAIIASGHLRGRGAHDHLNFHEPAIYRFASQWPSPDVGDYVSATTPGYHIALAWVVHTFGLERKGLQVVSSLFSGAMLGLIGWSLAGTVGPRRAVLLALPLVGSLYTFFPAVWILPDNAAWLLVTFILLGALSGRSPLVLWPSLAIALLLLVSVRQIHLWTAAIAWACAWLGTAAAMHPARRWDVAALFTPHFGRRIGRLGVMVVLTLPAFILLAWFVRVWGGLTPPAFQDMYHGGNPAAPGFILAIFGLYAPFYAMAAWPALAKTIRSNLALIVASACVGLLLVVIPETSFDKEAGRYAGLWNVVRETPVVAGRSLILMPLAMFGGAALAAFLGSVTWRDRWILLVCFVASTVAQSTSYQIWQRYNEPLVLLMLSLLAARAIEGENQISSIPMKRPRRIATIDVTMLGTLVLGLALAAMTTAVIWKAQPVKDLQIQIDPKYAAPGWSMPPGVVPSETRPVNFPLPEGVVLPSTGSPPESGPSPSGE
jgi:hypothetical protein